jgi:nucleotide-binding universal stress UspA family protein
MSEQQDIRRILVALDASTYSLVALQAAVSLAAEQKAELIGLFVEDINLLHLSELPFTREIRRLSVTASQLSGTRMKAAMQIQAARARRALEEAAARAEVVSNFRIVRGHVSLELLAASLEVDLLILGRVSQPLTRRVKAGSTARKVALQASRSVLLTQPLPSYDQAVMVTFAGTKLGWRALATAVPLTQSNQTLIILLINGSQNEREQWQAETAVWLQQKGITAQYRFLEQATPHLLALAAQKTRCSLFVLSGESSSTSEEILYTLLDTLDCSLLFIR